MQKSEVLQVIYKHFRENVDIDEDVEINPSLAMSDQGAGSLDIVEIISAATRELQIKIPRTELINLKNIDELADLFYTKLNESS